MLDDPRCCGSGTCIIDPEGRCWCGQVWDGRRTEAPPVAGRAAPAAAPDADAGDASPARAPEAG